MTLRIVGIEHADAAGGVQPVHGPAGEDIDRAGIATEAEQTGQVFFEIGLVEFLDLRFEGILERLLHPGRGIDVRRHVDVVGARTMAGLEDRVVRVAIAAIERDGNFAFDHGGGDFARFHGIELQHLEAASLGGVVQDVRVSGIDVRQKDAIETIVVVEFASDDRTDASEADNQCVGHKNGTTDYRWHHSW
ncbi:MAG: hypothetical protein WDN28_11150 [Chthoniobacter sp.]